MTKHTAVWIVSLVGGLVLGVGLVARPADAATTIDMSIFYERLAPYGHWVNHVHYGWV
jgi:hypothetical protein